MALTNIAFPRPRLNRTGPTPTGAAAAPTAPPSPRMRLFSLARDTHVQPHNVMVSPRITGPAVIKDLVISLPNQAVLATIGTKIYVADDDGGGIVSSANVQNPSGDVIFEDLLFKYAGSPPAASPYLHGQQQFYTQAGERTHGTPIALDYLVTRPSFYVKLYLVGTTAYAEGLLRVLEGIDPADFLAVIR